MALNNIPHALKTKARWILWKLEEVDGKTTKVPYIAHPTKTNKANVTDGANWSSFDRALECLNTRGDMSGIGYCLADDDNKVFFDFDHCISDDGVIDEQVDALVKELNSYTEVSQSGRGLHVIVGSSAPTLDVRSKIKNHHNGIDYETYYDGRYVAVTGNTIPEYPTDVRDNPSTVEKVWKEYFNKSPVVHVPSTYVCKANEELWKLMFNSKSGAAIRNLFDGVSCGDDSADDMSLLNHLAFWTGRDPAQMESMFNESALGKRAKWAQRADYRKRSIERAIQDCTEVYTQGRTTKMSPAEALKLVEGLEEKAKTDSSVILDTRILEALAIIRDNNPVQADLLVAPVVKLGVSRKSISSMLDKVSSTWVVESDDEVPNVDPEIHTKAMEVLEHGDPIEYIVDACSKMVVGARNALTKLICCVSVSNIKSTQGLHPKLNGKSSGGKTHTVMVFTHHLPPEMVNKGSQSAKAAFYFGFPARTWNVKDDYAPGGNEDMDTTIKQTSSTYHQPYEHKTVVDGAPVSHTVGPEQIWVITSVDASQDIQVLNRQLPINVDDSDEMTKQVNDRTIERYGNGEVVFGETEEVLVCREMFRIMRDADYIGVRIPFHNRIKWLDVSNGRNAPIFMDIVVGITGMYRFQREVDADGYYLATEEDFRKALALFTEKSAMDEMTKRLTAKEAELANLLSVHPDGMIGEAIAEALGVGTDRVRKLVKQLSNKIDGVSTTRQSMSVGDEIRRTTTQMNVYRLTGYSPLQNYAGVVTLVDA
jgi:primase-polymerase (primpol)-like protein